MAYLGLAGDYNLSTLTIRAMINDKSINRTNDKKILKTFW
jgi:hypothetical protein